MARITVSEQFAVSIHALLAECDGHSDFIYLDEARFNPRTPCGVRQCLV